MTEIQTIDSTPAVEVTSASHTINISYSDLEFMASSLEKSLITSQIELAEAEQKALKLRTEIGRVAGFLSVIKGQLKG
jgi:hypothetical protein